MVKLKKRTNKRKKLLRRKKTMRLKIKGGSNVTIIMMWMEGCGHCVLLKETWLLLKEELQDVIFIDLHTR